MKILLLSEYFPISLNSEITGGVEMRSFNIANYLSENNDVTVITSWREGMKREDKINKIKVIRTGPGHKYSNQAGFLSRILFARSAIKEGLKHKDLDIIDGLNFTTYYPAHMIAKKLNKPCIITYHETWVGEWIQNKGLVTGIIYDIYERLLLSLKYEKIISVSDFTKRRLVSNGINLKKIVVVPNGINPEEFNKQSKKEKIPTICFIGRLVKTKKADILIRALAIIKKNFPDITCKIIGQGKEMEKLEKLANDLNLKQNIKFLGFIKDTKEVREILKSSTIFCLPSVAEGFGIVILEAMASSTPYICSDIEVFKEITSNGKGGFLFKKNDEIDLADKALILLKNKKTYQQKIIEGQEQIKKYEWKKIAASIEKIYLKIIKEYKT